MQNRISLFPYLTTPNAITQGSRLTKKPPGKAVDGETANTLTRYVVEVFKQLIQA